ncbi:Bifunctional dehydrogenase and ferrochelatase [Orbilia oligospora]|uniref:precorrin-2 dehydrogenase n=1 Tax=Orbilia oligospora TaxID=2813651 RepID=A0A8H8V3C7_ORBOL|nr:Bifunctional dehydrogenase and ferrochelatase [Orbilia oligospora]
MLPAPSSTHIHPTMASLSITADPLSLIPTFPNEDPSTYPPIQSGGSLILAWQIRNKRVLLVGGGNVAATRLVHLLSADALVTLICPPSGLHPETAYRLKTHETRVSYIPRNFEPSDLSSIPSISLVLTAIDDPVASTEIYTLCKSLNYPVNVADVPPECDFYFGSVHRDGPLQIMVSTGGNGPKLAAMIRRKVADSLPKETSKAIVKVGELRKMLRAIAPEKDEGAKRMEWMSRVCENWEFEELAEMTEGDMKILLEGYKDGVVKRYKEVKLLESVRSGEEEDDRREGKPRDA